MKSKFELEHIGINTPNAEEAEKLANLLSLVFNLEPRHGQKSEFAGPYFECMKAPFLGTNGHIAMRTPNLAAAMEELKEKERCLQKRLEGLHEALSVKPDVMEIIHIPSRRCVQIMEHITRDEEMDFVMKKLHRRHEDKIKDFGNQTVGARFDMEGLRQGASNVYDSVFFVLEEDASLYDFELPEGNYLSLFYQGGYLQNGRRVKEALSWLEEKGLYASGAAFELYAIDNRDTSLEEEFLTEIQIPVSAASSRASKP